jgi:hypothetical protein
MAVLLSYALCTKEDVKESLGIASSDSSYDNLIIRMINKATLAIENYTGRRFALTTYTDEEYNGTGTDQLVLRQRPIVGIVTLENRDTSLNEADFSTVDSELFFTNADAGILDLNFGASGRWSRYGVTYQAGYAEIPADIAEACVALACFYVLNADSTSVNVSEKREGQRSLKYATGATSGMSFDGILAQLGIDSILQSYSNYPITGNK